MHSAVSNASDPGAGSFKSSEFVLAILTMAARQSVHSEPYTDLIAPEIACFVFSMLYIFVVLSSSGTGPNAFVVGQFGTEKDPPSDGF